MTKEQEQAIKVLEQYKKECIEEYKVELDDKDNIDQPHAFYLHQQIEAVYTVLNMLEEKDRQIESKNRLLGIIGRELHQAETELEKKNKIIDLIKAELEEKNKMIDLMAQDKYENVDMYQMADIGYEIGYDLAKLFSGIPDEEVLNIIKQYFEGRVKDGNI